MIHWKRALQIAAVYVGTIVGAGFATGKEIIEFFSQYGFIGLIGILISGYLFIFFGVKIMTVSIRIKARSYEQVNNYLFGSFFSPFVNIMMFLMLIGVTSVMLSGAGAVFQEHLYVPKLYGVLFTVCLAGLVMIIGTKGLVYVNSFVVPIMILFCFYLAIQVFSLPSFWERIFSDPVAHTKWEGFITPFTYTAFNLALAQAVLVPLASEVNDEKSVKLGGIIGGAVLTVILLSNHSVLMMLPNFYIYEIPMAVMMNQLASYLYVAYIFIIYSEIFTSVIGNIYGLERLLHKYVNINRIWIFVFILFVALIISKMDYGTLLSYLYPLFGYISLIYMFLLWKKAKN